MSEMFPDFPTTPIEALFDGSGVHPNQEGEAWQELLVAEIVTGVDVMSRHEFLVYGRQTLQQIATSGKTRRLRVLRIELDQATDDLERLCALMHFAKARCDYLASGQQDGQPSTVKPTRAELVRRATPVSSLSEAQVLVAVETADIVAGYDITEDKLWVFSQRRLEPPCTVSQVTFSYASASEVERLVACVVRVRGHCCYPDCEPGNCQAPESSEKTNRPRRTTEVSGAIEVKVLEDGTQEVRTTATDLHLQERRAADEARLREAVEQMRRQGIGHPVVLLIQEGANVEGPAGSIRVRLEDDGGWCAHVVTPVDARRLLAPILGTKARNLFRVPRWPVSYWTVQFYAGGRLEWCESCFWGDVPDNA